MLTSLRSQHYTVIPRLIVAISVAGVVLGARVAASSNADGGTVLVLAEGIDSLSRPSADFRGILRRTQVRMPQNADATVRAALARFIGRLPAAGTDLKCGDDFLRNRARQELMRLRQTLLKVGVDPLEPQFCFADPYAIDSGKPPNAIEIYGFDFDAVPTEMFLVNRGNYENVSSALIHRSHYHLTINVGRNGVRLRSNSQSLGLTWGNLIHHSIPIVAPATKLCRCEIEEISRSEPIAYTPPALHLGNPTGLTPGHAFASAMLDYESNAVYATICMTAVDREILKLRPRFAPAIIRR